MTKGLTWKKAIVYLQTGLEKGEELACYRILIVVVLCSIALFNVTLAQESAMPIKSDEILIPATPPETDIGNPEALDAIVDPETYYVGPGDQFTVIFTGKLVKRHTLTVTPEGVLLMPEFGPIDVARLTLSEAKASILAALSHRYRDVPTSVFLTALRNVKVSVSGAVKSSGVYVLSAGSRVGEAIQSAGGLEEYASQRNIRLFRSDSLIIVDLLRYYNEADTERNPYVREGDAIVVPTAEGEVNRVGIYGAVRSPSRFEYSPYDNLRDLITLAHGLTTDADSFDLELVRFNDDGITSQTIAINLPRGEAWTDSVARIKLYPDDRVFFRRIPLYHETAQVIVSGEVVYPGSYPIVEDSTRLSEVIERAGGLTEDASLSEAYMDRAGYTSLEEADFERRLKLSVDKRDDIEEEYLKFQSTGHPGRVSVDFHRLLIDKDGAYDILLKDGDRIEIPSLSRTVRVIGRVIRPGLVQYSPNKDSKYYIQQTGGYGWKANKGKVRIIKASSRAIVETSKDTPIEVGDAIVVPERVERDLWGTIKDVGVFLANLATIYIVIDQVLK